MKHLDIQLEIETEKILNKVLMVFIQMQLIENIQMKIYMEHQ